MSNSRAGAPNNNMFSDYQRAGIGAGLGGMLGGLFGNSEDPYKAASQQYDKYGQMGAQAQQPWQQAGQQAIPQYQNWLQNQQNPSGFINNLMNQYQQSPWAAFQQQQGQRAANNAASASGLVGSTPYMQASQDYAHNISQQDMGQWLQNVLGINSQYGQGQQQLMSGGQNAANNLTSLYGNLGSSQGEAAYGRKAGGNQDMFNMLGGIGTIASMFL